MTSLPTQDTDRFDAVRVRLNTPLIGDVLDVLGRRHQFLPPDIRPLVSSMVMVGRAMPVLIADVFGPQTHPFGRLTEALDSLQADEVYLARSGRMECAAWGEILTTASRARGAAGAVIDGYHRDTGSVIAQNWPVFSRGCYAQDAGVRASVLDYRISIEVGGVTINPGDLVVGDVDGVVVVPSEIEDEVLEGALEKAAAEKLVLRAIEAGMSCTEAFITYGVL